MTTYTAPLKDMAFVLHDVLNVSTRDIPGYADLDRGFTTAVLEEAGKLASDVLAPLNAVGDHEGCALENGAVRTPSGFKSAFDQLRTGGWTALDCDPEFGGQGLPWAVAFPVQEMWQAANMAFGLCPLLNQGAVEAILSHGSNVVISGLHRRVANVLAVGSLGPILCLMHAIRYSIE